MWIWFAVLVVLLILILYIRKENLEAEKKPTDSKEDPKKESKDTTEAKDDKETTIIIVGNQDKPYPRFADPFYTMTDPYWSSYNYRPFGYGYIGPRHHIGYHRPFRRVW